MSTQDKIKELAEAALRSAPPSAGIPKPATFMPSTVRPAMPARTKEAPVAAEAPASPVGSVPEEPAPAVFKDEGDPEFRAMIDAREEKLAKRRSRQRLALALSVLVLFGATGGWIYASPGARAQIAALVPALKEARQDVRMMGSMVSQYDESLEEIGTHGGRIDDATRALGIDPASVGEGDDPNMEAEMAQMMGGEDVPTTASRNRVLKEKFGFVEKLADKGTESPGATGAE